MHVCSLGLLPNIFNQLIHTDHSGTSVGKSNSVRTHMLIKSDMLNQLRLRLISDVVLQLLQVIAVMAFSGKKLGSSKNRCLCRQIKVRVTLLQYRLSMRLHGIFFYIINFIPSLSILGIVKNDKH